MGRQNQAKELRKMAVNRDDLSINISVESEDAKKALSSVSKQLSELDKMAVDSGKSIKDLSGVFSKFGAGMIVANQVLEVFGKIQGTVAKALELTAQRAIKLETSIARISTILTPTEKAQLNLNEAILGMRAAFGTDLEQIAGGLYESIDNNAIGAKNSILFLNEAQKLAIATGKGLTETADELGRVIAAYGMSAEDAAHASDVLLVASREGSVGIDQLIKSTSQMSDVASQAGASFEEFTFGVAALTTSGISGQKATAYLTEAITAIITPAEDMKNIISSLGFESGKALIQTKGLAGAIELISSKTDGSEESLKNLFGSIKVGSSVVQLASGEMRKTFDGMFKTVAEGSLTTQDAFEKMSKTTEQSMKVMEGRVDVAFTKIGQVVNSVLLPAVIGIGNAFASFSERIAAIDFAGLTKTLWDLVKVIGAVGIAIEATLLAMGAGTFVIGGLATAIGAAATASFAFIAAWSPVILAVGAAVVALDLLIANFNILIGKQKEFSGGFFGKVLTEGKKLMFGLGEETKKTADEVKNLDKTVSSVGPTIQNAFGGIGVEFLKKATEGIKSLKDMTTKYSEELKKLATARGLTGDSEMQKIEAQRQFGLEQIRMIETQAQKAGILTAANKQLIKDLEEAKKKVNELARAQRIASNNASILGDLDKTKKDLVDITNENMEANTRIYSMYKNEFDILQDQVDAAIRKNNIEIERFDIETKLIEAKRDQLVKDKASTEEIQKANDLLNERAGIKAAKKERNEIITADARGKVESAGIGIANSIVSSMASGADALVGTIISTVGKAFGPIGDIVAGLINVFRNGYEFMKNLGKELIMIIVELPLMIAEGIVGLVEGILEAVVNTLADPEKLGRILTAFTSMIPKVLGAIARALPGIMRTIFSVKFWADMISSAFVALRDSFLGMFGSIFGMFKGISKNITKGFTDGVKAGLDQLAGFGQKVFAVVADVAGMASGQSASSGGGKSIEEAMKKAGSWWAGFVKNTSKFLFDLFWGIVDIIGTVMGELMKIIDLVFSIPEKIFKAIGDIIMFLWEGIKQLPGFLIDAVIGLFDAVIGLIESIWPIIKAVIIDPFVAIFNQLATVISDIGKAVYEGVIKPIFDAFSNLASWLFEAFSKVWNFIIELPGKLVDGIAQIGTGLWTAIQKVPEFLKNAASGLVNGLTEGIKEVGEKVKTIIIEPISKIGKSIWEGIEKIGTDVSNFFKKLFSFPESKGTVEKWANFDIPVLRFAEGGNVPGQPKVFGDSYKNDSVPALLSPGEYVLPRSITKNQKLFDWIMQIVQTGKLPEMHAFGIKDAVNVGKQFVTDTKQSFVEVRDKVTSASIPPQVRAIYDWINENIGGIDIGNFIKNPIGEATKIFERSIGRYFKGRSESILKGIMGNKFHQGGLVGSYAFGGEVPAMLQSGEFVMNRRAVSNIGESNLGNMNLGRSGSFGQGDTTINIDLKIDTEQPIDEAFIKSKLIPSLKKELRDSSLRGEFIMSQKGLR
jgi:TP901 family phage tail tape measure protein